MPLLNLKSRLLIEFGENIDENNKLLIKRYWALNDYGKFKEDNISYSDIEKAKKNSTVKFNNGVYKDLFKQIDGRGELLKEIDLFNEKLEKEFQTINEQFSNSGKKIIK